MSESDNQVGWADTFLGRLTDWFDTEKEYNAFAKGKMKLSFYRDETGVLRYAKERVTGDEQG